MISRRTGWLIWGSLLLPISLLIAIKTFDFGFSHLLNRQPPNTEERLWYALGSISFVIGSLCALLLPFSLIRDFSRKKRKLS
jgi:hypothetical protein